MSRPVVVAELAELTPGTARVVQVGELEIALYNVDGHIYATENTCCHRGGPLGDGDLDATTITCPWHMWRFDVRTGNCINSPGDYVRTYEVHIEEGTVRLGL